MAVSLTLLLLLGPAVPSPGAPLARSVQGARPGALRIDPPVDLRVAPRVASRVASRADSEGDLARELRRLGSPAVEERRAAQRWLGTHLRRSDFSRAAEAARDGDAEVRRRLAQALAADDRHLGLAVLFLTDRDERLSEIGRVAIEDLVDRWNAAAEEPPRAPRSLPAEWLELETRAMAIELRAGSIGALVDRVERLAPAPATLVLDPSLDPGVYGGPPLPVVPGDAGQRFAGPWTELMLELARLHQVSFEVHGFRVPLRGARPWVRVHERGLEPGANTTELCLEWCRGVVRPGDRARNVACARALAALGWPAAVAWFEELWLERDDPAAREALLLAAARGRVAPSLADPLRLRGLLASVDRDLAQQAQGALARAEQLALALASVGPLGSDERWTSVLSEGWEGLGPASRWLRLVAFEGHGRGDERARRFAREEFARAGRPGLRLQALRTLASLTAGESLEADGAKARHLAAPGELLEGARGRLDELGLYLIEAAIPFPQGDWHATVTDPTELALLLGWSLAAGGDDSAIEFFWRVLAADSLDALAQRLRDWCGSGRAEAVRALLEAAESRARDLPARTAVARLRLRAGLLDGEGERRALDALLDGSALKGPELVDLGVLCGSIQVGWRAREALVEQVALMPPPADLESAVVAALAALARVRQGREADVLASRLRTAADRAGHPLLARLLSAGFPPFAPPAPRDLDALERRVDPRGF